MRFSLISSFLGIQINKIMSISPYQYEPINKNYNKKSEDSDDEWEDIDEESEGEQTASADLDEEKLKRLECSPSVWCKCNCCKTMPVNRECLCCTEIDDIKYNKLSEGMFCI